MQPDMQRGRSVAGDKMVSKVSIRSMEGTSILSEYVDGNVGVSTRLPEGEHNALYLE